MDPRVYQVADITPGPLVEVYRGAAGLVDLIYIVTNPVLMLLNWLTSVVFILVPALENPWFPAAPGVLVAQGLGGESPLLVTVMSKIFVGVFDWLSLLAIVLIVMVSPSVDKAYEAVKNLVWYFIIEHSFTQKKQALYQEALLKRSRDLMKLNVEYRNLSHEASLLKDSVNTDGLTQVFNKRFFTECMTEVFAKAKEKEQPLGLLMVDIDHFKKLNDTYGHLFGDDVLREIAEVLKMVCPPSGYVCRFGGEEFAMIFPDLPFETVLSVAENIKTGLAGLTFEMDRSLQVSVSQGLVHLDFKQAFARALDEVDDFVKFADDELYRAKLEGRARICVNQLG